MFYSMPQTCLGFSIKTPHLSSWSSHFERQNEKKKQTKNKSPIRWTSFLRTGDKSDFCQFYAVALKNSGVRSGGELKCGYAVRLTSQHCRAPLKVLARQRLHHCLRAQWVSSSVLVAVGPLPFPPHKDQTGPKNTHLFFNKHESYWWIFKKYYDLKCFSSFCQIIKVSTLRAVISFFFFFFFDRWRVLTSKLADISRWLGMDTKVPICCNMLRRLRLRPSAFKGQ